MSRERRCFDKSSEAHTVDGLALIVSLLFNIHMLTTASYICGLSSSFLTEPADIGGKGKKEKSDEEEGMGATHPDGSATENSPPLP